MTVSDENDNVPEFTEEAYEFIVMEHNINDVFNQPVSVGHVIAVDRDQGENGRVNYRIVNGNPGMISVLLKMREVAFARRAQYCQPCSSFR